MKPVLKFLGGKRNLLPFYAEHLPPEGFRCDFVEPMCGGAAPSFAWARRWQGTVTVTDANKHLVELMTSLTTDAGNILAQAESLAARYNALDDAGRKAFFHEARHAVNGGSSPAYFWLVNQVGFNGLVRYSKKGKLNTPWGHRAKVPPAALANLRAASVGLAQADVRVAAAGDFTQVLDFPTMDWPNTAILFDPPYDGDSTFREYTPKRFYFRDHVRLRDLVVELINLGAHPYVCNADTEAVRELYRGVLDAHEVSAPRPVNSDGSGRGAARELFLVPTGGPWWR